MTETTANDLCPYCMREIPPGAEECVDCRNNVDIHLCPNCGEVELEVGDQCRYCGYILKRVIAEASIFEGYSSKIILYLVIYLGGLLLGFFLYRYYSRPTSGENIYAVQLAFNKIFIVWTVLAPVMSYSIHWYLKQLRG